MTHDMWELAIALITAVTCSLCGTFLVIKRESLVSEGLSHAVLPGIVLAFIVFRDRSSPLLIVGAALTGLIMVALTQLIRRTKLVDGEASLGLVFAALFSVGIILSSQKINNVHFHAHCIIDGNLTFAPLNKLEFGDWVLGPKSFYVMLTTLILVVTFIVVFYKELKLALFDETLSKSFGLRPVLLHYSWLGLVSLTTVAAFETAGSILVVALMITPPAMAILLTNQLHKMLWVSAVISSVCAAAGLYAGRPLDIAPSGPIASISGFLFLVVLFVAPTKGIVAKHLRRKKQRAKLFRSLLLHQVSESSDDTNGVALDLLLKSAIWKPKQFEEALQYSLNNGYVHQQNGEVTLTANGLKELNHQQF